MGLRGCGDRQAAEMNRARLNDARCFVFRLALFSPFQAAPAADRGCVTPCPGDESMSIYPVSSAIAPAVLNSRSPAVRPASDSEPSSPSSAARPKPDPRDSAEFFRAIFDDCHPGNVGLTAYSAEEVELAANTIAAPKEKTMEERIEDLRERQAASIAELKAHRARRDHHWQEMIEERSYEREQTELEFREVQAANRAAAEARETEIKSALLMIRAGINERLATRDGHGYGDLGTDIGLFAFAESTFGDSFELSWESAAALEARNPECAPL